MLSNPAFNILAESARVIHTSVTVSINPRVQYVNDTLNSMIFRASEVVGLEIVRNIVSALLESSREYFATNVLKGMQVEPLASRPGYTYIDQMKTKSQRYRFLDDKANAALSDRTARGAEHVAHA